MGNTLKQLGKRIRAARREAGLTLVQLGKRIGCSHSALSQIETGDNMPTIETLDAIGRELATTFTLGQIPKVSSGQSAGKTKSPANAAL